jgi:hypothetical protein
MEVRFARERDRRPGPSFVLRSNEAEERRRPILEIASVRVAGAEEQIRPRNREAHRVLILVADPLRLGLAPLNSVEPGVRSDEERPVARVETETVNMNRTGIIRRDPRKRLRFLAAAATRDD